MGFPHRDTRVTTFAHILNLGLIPRRPAIPYARAGEAIKSPGGSSGWLPLVFWPLAASGAELLPVGRGDDARGMVSCCGLGDR